MPEIPHNSSNIPTESSGQAFAENVIEIDFQCERWTRSRRIQTAADAASRLALAPVIDIFTGKQRFDAEFGQAQSEANPKPIVIDIPASPVENLVTILEEAIDKLASYKHLNKEQFKNTECFLVGAETIVSFIEFCQEQPRSNIKDFIENLKDESFSGIDKKQTTYVRADALNQYNKLKNIMRRNEHIPNYYVRQYPTPVWDLDDGRFVKEVHNSTYELLRGRGYQSDDQQELIKNIRSSLLMSQGIKEPVKRSFFSTSGSYERSVEEAWIRYFDDFIRRNQRI